MHTKKLSLLALGVLGCTVCVETEKRAVEPFVKSPKSLDSDMIFVNMQDAMLRSLSGKQAQKVVEEEEMRYAELAQKEQQQMVKLKTELDTQGSMLSPDARRKMDKELNDKQRDFQNKVQDWRGELQYTMQRETDAMMKEIEHASKVLAENLDKAVVVDALTGRVLYLREDRNSTDDLIAILDNQHAMKFAQKDKEKSSGVAAATPKALHQKMTVA